MDSSIEISSPSRPGVSSKNLAAGGFIRRAADLIRADGLTYHRVVSTRLRAWVQTDAPPDELVPVGRGGVLFCLAAFLVGVLALGSIQFSKVELVGTDAYHHTRVARVIAEQGVLDAFPWTTASVFRDHYADKQFLFHVLLIPFLGDDLTFGPKLLTVLLGALLLAIMAWVLLRHGAPLPTLWVTLVLAAGVLFLFRMSLTRPHLLSVPLAVLAVHFLLGRNLVGSFLVALLFPLCYTAAHLLPGLALLYALACALRSERVPWKLVGAVVVATLAGLLIHPHRFDIFRLWYIQNVEVVLNVWRIPDEVVMGNEFFSVAGSVFLWDTVLVLLCVFLVLLGMLLRGGAASLRTVYLFLVSCGFLVLFLNIPRFIEYWVPFTVLFAASAARDLLTGFDARGWLRRHRLAGPVLVGLFLVLFMGQTVRSVVESQLEVRNDHSEHYRFEADWIARNVPPGEVVFTCNWDSFPYLFHFAPEQRYLVALDPTFMQAYDPELFRDWYRIATGQEPEAPRLILTRFGARWVFAEKRSWILPFIARADRDPRLLKVLDGPEAAVYTLLADVRPLAAPLAAAGAAALAPGPWPRPAGALEEEPCSTRDSKPTGT